MDGPGRLRNHSKRWGAKRPAFWSGFWGPRAGAVQTPTSMISGSRNTRLHDYINTQLGLCPGPMCKLDPGFDGTLVYQCLGFHPDSSRGCSGVSGFPAGPQASGPALGKGETLNLERPIDVDDDPTMPRPAVFGLPTPVIHIKRMS